MFFVESTFLGVHSLIDLPVLGLAMSSSFCWTSVFFLFTPSGSCATDDLFGLDLAAVKASFCRLPNGASTTRWRMAAQK